MKAKILEILRKSEGYVSGQQLCKEFQVSRTAVWKVIEQLKEEGYQIEAIRNKGYHLKESPDILSSANLESMMQTAWAGRSVLSFDTVDSTNIQAKKAGEDSGVHGLLIVAERQTAGKGRRGRSWQSPSGNSIYMSILLRPRINPNKAPMLTLVMAKSVAEAIREVTGLDVKIKWPNDLVLNKKKICGILTEMSAEIDYIQYVVIGIGINVNEIELSPEISETATSLRIESGKEYPRADLIATSMRYFEQNYEKFMETEDLSGLQQSYNELLVNRNRDVRVLEPGNEYDGHALGIRETGELLVEKPDGTVMEVFAGEVSVRGIYGYV